MTVPPTTSLEPSESRNSEGWIRGASDDRSLPGVDGGTEEGLDPALPPRAPREGGVVRILRSEGRHAVSRAAAPRRTRVRREPLAGAGERHAAEVLPPDGPRTDRALGGTRSLGRDDDRRGTRAEGSPMTPHDEYLDRVRRAMAGMDPAVRDDILRELGSHIAESMAANGGNADATISGLGSPTEVGRHYRAVYGYGRAFRSLFAVVAFLLAIPSIPVLITGDQGLFPFGLSVVFLGIVAAWVLWVSASAGARAGLIAGIAAFAGRLVAFGAVAATQAGGIATAGGIGLLAIASVMLVALGWLPGTAKKTWSGPRAEL